MVACPVGLPSETLSQKAEQNGNKNLFGIVFVGKNLLNCIRTGLDQNFKYKILCSSMKSQKQR